MWNWLRGKRWVYLGCNTLFYSDYVEKGYAATVHFYIRNGDQSKRKVEIATVFEYTRRNIVHSQWYQENVVPWLNGGNLWKPIRSPLGIGAPKDKDGKVVDFPKGA